VLSAEATNRDLHYFGYQKPNLIIIVLFYIVFKKMTTNALSYRTQFIFDKPSSYFAVRELDVALGNHALHVRFSTGLNNFCVAYTKCIAALCYDLIYCWRAIARQHTILYNRAKSAKFVGCKIGDMRSRFRF